MDTYTGRLLANRYRLPKPPAEEFELVESRAYDTASGQEVLVRQVPLPEVVDAETLDDDGYGHLSGAHRAVDDRPTRTPADPVVRRAVEAVVAAAQLPEHPRLGQVFDVFVQGGGLWIVSELLTARPLAAVLAEERLGPYRAAEVAADLLAALRIVHAHGWTHRNLTARTVLICDDGRAVLIGLAVGAAEEALCGYDPLPPEVASPTPAPAASPAPASPASGGMAGQPPQQPHAPLSPAAAERAARSGAIAAYRAGTRAGRRSGAGATDVPGPGRTSHVVRTGWEPAPRRAPDPAEPSRRLPHQAGPWHEAQPNERQAARPPRDRYRGPGSALAAERARQARIATVGAVTERWAPEQAGPVHEHWRLAPPVGPPADFWALGALLFRAVQGYPPYPEERASELTQAVCAEPPAFAEDCGPLRPIIESLLRQDPTERPCAEELRGWLRSLLRAAPEPEVGRHTVTAAAALASPPPTDPRRLPIVRRRGELVGPRRRRAAKRRQRDPRRLGKLVLTFVLAGLAAAVGSVLVLLAERGPGAGDADQAGAPQEQRPPDGSPGPAAPQLPQQPEAHDDVPRETSPEGEDALAEGPTTDTGGGENPEPAPPPSGFEAVRDPAGFSLWVPEGWRRASQNSDGQVIYSNGPLELLVVPGRDAVADFGEDPMRYQLQSQRELQPYRDAEWKTSRDLQETRVGDAVMVEGVFSWNTSGEQLAHNRVMLIQGAYHVVLLRGPTEQENRMAEIYETSASSYQPAG